MSEVVLPEVLEVVMSEVLEVDMPEVVMSEVVLSEVVMSEVDDSYEVMIKTGDSVIPVWGFVHREQAEAFKESLTDALRLLGLI